MTSASIEARSLSTSAEEVLAIFIHLTRDAQSKVISMCDCRIAATGDKHPRFGMSNAGTTACVLAARVAIER